MNRQPNPTSSPSSTSYGGPPASLSLRPARGLAVLLYAFLLAVPLLTFASGGAWRIPRTLLAVGAALAGGSAIRRDVLRRGPRAVVALSWDVRGGFVVELGSGVLSPAYLGHGSLAVGPFLCLVLQGRRRHPVFIDRRGLDPAEAAALLRALRQIGRRGDDLR